VLKQTEKIKERITEQEPEKQQDEHYNKKLDQECVFV
jgi:hypothetical protein